MKGGIEAHTTKDLISLYGKEAPNDSDIDLS